MTPNATIDDLYASEVYYSIHMGLLFDLKLLFRRLANKIKSIKTAMRSTEESVQSQRLPSDANNSH